MANHYIRAGAAGANDGSSWTNAWTTFAAAILAGIVRGDTYYIAGGDYSSETPYINIPLSGSLWIYFKKANVADNSGDAGWNISYATTLATIKSFDLDKGYISIDGVTGSGTSGHGIHVYNTAIIDNSYAIQLEAVAPPFSLSHLNIEGGGFSSGSGSTVGVYSANTGTTKNIYVGNCWIHQFTTNGVIFTGTMGTSYSDYGLLFENNVISETGGCTDVDKHGQGMHLGLSLGMTYTIIRNNVFRNIVGSAMISFLTGASNLTYANIEIYNNIFYLTDPVAYAGISPGAIWWEGSHNGTNTGMVLTNLLIQNNAFYNITGPSNYAAVSLGSGSNETITNAIIQNCIYETCFFGSAPFQLTSQSNNGYFNNTGGGNIPSGTTNQVNGSSSAFVNAPAFNFHLATGGYAVGAGLDLSGTFTTDADGATRTAPWTLGVYIYGAGLYVLKRLGAHLKLFGLSPA